MVYFYRIVRIACVTGIFLTVLISSVKAQNFIPNPGFELGYNVDHELFACNGSIVTFSGTAEDVFQRNSAMKIINAFGQVLIRLENFDSETNIDVSSLQTGIYLLTILNKSGIKSWKPFIIAR